jgi:hypothetical protein
MLRLARTLILMLVALLALGALGMMAYAPGESSRNDDVVRRDDSYDVQGVSDDDDDEPGKTPTNDTVSDSNTNGEWSNGTRSDYSTLMGELRE